MDYRVKYNKVVLISLSPLTDGWWKLEGNKVYHNLDLIETLVLCQPLTPSRVCSCPPGLSRVRLQRLFTRCSLSLYT